MKRDRLVFKSVVFGCDPELFFSRDGVNVSSDLVLPKAGLTDFDGKSKIVIDGVQAELNPSPNSCRQTLARRIRYCFINLAEHIKEKDVTIDFAPNIKLSQMELDSLDSEVKKLGCKPSKNVYTGGKDEEITVDPSTYQNRSAGGHIHLGYISKVTLVEEVLSQPDRLVPVLDTLLGNTCVLLDREESNKTRRDVYGKAGEYRLPKHGLEYRTLSNFWLRSYPLMSLVFGLARMSVIIVANKLDKELLDLVSEEDIKMAINDNNFDLALANFRKIEKFLREITNDKNDDQYTYPLGDCTMDAFYHFVEKGMDHWFKTDPLAHWLDHNSSIGIENLLLNTVSESMRKSK